MDPRRKFVLLASAAALLVLLVGLSWWLDRSAAGNPGPEVPAARSSPGGAPLAHVMVRLVPSSAGRKAQDLPLNFQFDPVELDAFPSSVTGDDGRFEIAGRDVRPEVGTVSVQPGRFRQSDFPSVMFTHPGHSGTVKACAGWRGGDYDLGDVTLRAGVTLRARVVDPDGRPAPGAWFGVPRTADTQDLLRWDEWNLAKLEV